MAANQIYDLRVFARVIVRTSQYCPNINFHTALPARNSCAETKMFVEVLMSSATDFQRSIEAAPPSSQALELSFFSHSWDPLYPV